MLRNLIGVIASSAVALLIQFSGASAAVYKFTFQSNDAQLMATGEITVNAAEQVTAISGVISGLTNQTISGLSGNPSFPSPSYSPDGSFIYNNLYYTTGMSFDINGVLFGSAQNPGGYWNLWGASPGNYSLWESSGSYNYPIQESGTLSMAAAPEPSTWAMLGLGFVALGFVGRRRQRTARLAPSLG